MSSSSEERPEPPPPAATLDIDPAARDLYEFDSAAHLNELNFIRRQLRLADLPPSPPPSPRRAGALLATLLPPTPPHSWLLSGSSSLALSETSSGGGPPARRRCGGEPRDRRRAGCGGEPRDRRRAGCAFPRCNKVHPIDEPPPIIEIKPAARDFSPPRRRAASAAASTTSCGLDVPRLATAVCDFPAIVRVTEWIESVEARAQPPAGVSAQAALVLPPPVDAMVSESEMYLAEFEDEDEIRVESSERVSEVSDSSVEETNCCWRFCFKRRRRTFR